MAKLFTKEDHVGPVRHVHKILGFACLAHFVYRMLLYFILTPGDMGFRLGAWYTPLVPVAHLALSLSSFIFSIGENRNRSNQIIWRELQLHNIIFTARSCAIFALAIYLNKGQHRYAWVRFAVICAFHVAADAVSARYGRENTMRDMRWSDATPAWFIKLASLYYAASQQVAWLALVVSVSLQLETSFMVMLPIQLSTFLMTLMRKGMLSNNGWHALYAASLFVVYFVVFIDPRLEASERPFVNKPHAPQVLVALAITMAIARFALRINKYAIFLVATYAIWVFC